MHPAFLFEPFMIKFHARDCLTIQTYMHVSMKTSFQISLPAVIAYPAAALMLGSLPLLPASAEKLTPLQMEEGKYLSSICTTCHQPGKKVEGIPRITGYTSKEMMEMMMDYRGGKDHHGAMENIAQSLTDSELRILSSYLAITSPPKAPAQELNK